MCAPCICYIRIYIRGCHVGSGIHCRWRYCHLQSWAFSFDRIRKGTAGRSCHWISKGGFVQRIVDRKQSGGLWVPEREVGSTPHGRTKGIFGYYTNLWSYFVPSSLGRATVGTRTLSDSVHCGSGSHLCSNCSFKCAWTSVNMQTPHKLLKHISRSWPCLLGRGFTLIVTFRGSSWFLFKELLFIKQFLFICVVNYRFDRSGV